MSVCECFPAFHFSAIDDPKQLACAVLAPPPTYHHFGALLTFLFPNATDCMWRHEQDRSSGKSTKTGLVVCDARPLPIHSR